MCPCSFFPPSDPALFHSSYTINGSSITSVDHHKDLGVVMSSDLNNTTLLSPVPTSLLAYSEELLNLNVSCIFHSSGPVSPTALLSGDLIC